MFYYRKADIRYYLIAIQVAASGLKTHILKTANSGTSVVGV